MTNKRDKQKIRARLEEALEELTDLESTAADSAKTVELDQTRVGRLSRMDAMQSQAMSIESSRRQALHAGRIRAALLRLEQDEYGSCLECGEDINPKRLQADPAAPLCIDCAGRSETA